jgi:hypothetical protein
MTNEFKKVVRFWKVLASHSRIATQKGKVGNLAARLCKGMETRLGWARKGASGDGGRRDGDAIGETLRKALHSQGIKRQLRRGRYITICFLL